MAIRYAISRDLGLVYGQWSGTITLPQFFAVFEAFVSDPDYLPGRPELIDLSRVEDIDIDFNRMRRVLRMVNEQAPEVQVHTLTAIWAPTDMIFGLGRMYQQLAEMAEGIEVVVFREEAEVLDALSLPFESVAALLAGGSFGPFRP
jgi:hypothetical protein